MHLIRTKEIVVKSKEFQRLIVLFNEMFAKVEIGLVINLIESEIKSLKDFQTQLLNLYHQAYSKWKWNQVRRKDEKILQFYEDLIRKYDIMIHSVSDYLKKLDNFVSSATSNKSTKRLVNSLARLTFKVFLDLNCGSFLEIKSISAMLNNLSMAIANQ
ncbi:hypothetical protein [Mycoplasma amphoriforme]|uniref:Uncharacterized protein n=1 Tax=Mycoplasma amphoriforme A39 TaxID=572419 RepID=A0A292IIT6_9MOLU|nr:unnamed protein product [Mycoplasma amphoriforme A39]